MRADPDAIRSLSAAHSVMAADLAAAGRRVQAFPTAALTEAFGPVGAGFVAALAAAAARHGASVAALSRQAESAASTANLAATAYTDAEGRVEHRLDSAGATGGAD